MAFTFLTWKNHQFWEKRFSAALCIMQISSSNLRLRIWYWYFQWDIISFSQHIWSELLEKWWSWDIAIFAGTFAVALDLIRFNLCTETMDLHKEKHEFSQVGAPNSTGSFGQSRCHQLFLSFSKVLAVCPVYWPFYSWRASVLFSLYHFHFELCSVAVVLTRSCPRTPAKTSITA